MKLQESETFYYDMKITGDEAVRFVVSSVNESVTILVDSNGIGCEAKQNYSIIECDNPQLMQGISTFLACSCAEPYKVSCALTVYAARKYTESLEIDCSVTNGVGDVITESALLHIIGLLQLRLMRIYTIWNLTRKINCIFFLFPQQFPLLLQHLLHNILTYMLQ